MKPRKGLLKRVKITAKGKAKKRRAGSGHLLSHKSGKRRRQLRKANLIAGSDMKKVRRMAGLQ
ncbi:50S ribosomal protein L35 [Planctomycetota bacterium]